LKEASSIYWNSQRVRAAENWQGR